MHASETGTPSVRTEEQHQFKPGDLVQHKATLAEFREITMTVRSLRESNNGDTDVGCSGFTNAGEPFFWHFHPAELVPFNPETVEPPEAD